MIELSKQGREDYTMRLATIISEAMLHDSELRLDAIIEGRIGLKEMPDAELVDFGVDCWNEAPRPGDWA